VWLTGVVKIAHLDCQGGNSGWEPANTLEEELKFELIVLDNCQKFFVDLQSAACGIFDIAMFPEFVH